MEDKYKVIDIPIKEIYADPLFNCRGTIVPIDVWELMNDIKKNGLHSPIIIQPADESHGLPPDKKYRIVAGHRRHMAFLTLEKTTIPCMIRPDLSEIDSRLLNLSENLQRSDLSIYQEALAIKALKGCGLTEVEVAERLNKSRGWIQVRFMLLELPEDIQQEAKAGNLSQVNIRDLYSLRGNKDEMYGLVRRCKDLHAAGGRTVKPRANKKSAETKRLRNKAEIMQLQTVIRETFGAGIVTRCLAWICGEITDAELIEDIREMADEKGCIFKRPKNDCFSHTGEETNDVL